LAELPGVIGIKEATGNLERAAWLIKDAPDGFNVYSGDDPTAVALMLLGGHGNISVTANVAPKVMQELCKAAMAGDAARAVALHMQLLPLHQALFIEPNPIPVKWALTRMGKAKGMLRLPLTPLSTASQERLEAALHTCGIL
jgi:4-hydroxy-tetrahydrodipicolinate synthase